ncbi:MAG: cyclic nucleotide-binding domain-containing protein [Desulfopila sp.]
MTEAMQEQERLATLKTLNNTVVTIRFYPVNAPQTAKAIERGYKSVKTYLRQYGPFSFALRGDEQELCGERLDPQVVQSISNLIVFRQLHLLGKTRFRIAPGLDRLRFKRIIELFSARLDQISQEGGGRAYIARLGLENCFTDVDPQEERGQQGGRRSAVTAAGPAALIRREFIDVLLGRERRMAVISELMEIFHTPAAGAPIVIVTLQGVVDGMVQKGIFSRSPQLQQVVQSCDRVIGAEQSLEVIAETVRLVMERFDVTEMAFLLSQDLQGSFGLGLCRSLERRLPLEFFGQVVSELRQSAARLQAATDQDESSGQLRFVSEALARLVASPRGKQFLGQEKARTILADGEKARRARRIEAAIKALLQGNDEVLQREEITLSLPRVLEKMAAEHMDREIRVILTRILAHCQAGDGRGRRQLIDCLAQVGENLNDGKHHELLTLIHQPLFDWLRSAEDGDATYEKVCAVLHGVMAESWRRQEFDVGDKILSIFHQIRTEAIVRPVAIRAIVGKTQARGIDREIIGQLLQQCLKNPGDELCSRRLLLQGPIITRFLLDSLVRAKEARDRMKIVELLTSGEQLQTSILLDKFSEPMPWYGKRNLLKLLGETGEGNCLDLVYPYLQHDDLRVQREAFVCLYKLSGDERKEVLLRALNDCGEIMKLQVVRALLPFCDSQVADRLGQVLKEHQFYSDEFRDVLLVNVCQALARCPVSDAERVLRNFLGKKGDWACRKIASRVWEVAQEAIRQSQEAEQHKRQLQKKAGMGRADGGSPERRRPAMAGKEERKRITGLALEKTIHDLVEQGDTVVARVHLLGLIRQMAQLGHFTEAKRLRQWLIEIDPQALNDIIRATEIIEEERLCAVDSNHFGTWADLFDQMTTEEFGVFYYALRHRRYRNDELIVKKGAVQENLIFIDSGRVKLFYRDKTREVLAGTREGGQILGTGSFLDASLWTFSVAALGQVEIGFLDFDKVKAWQLTYPDLTRKLHDFCNRQAADDEHLFSRQGYDRRRYHRYTTPPHPLTISFASTGEEDLLTRGRLIDISRGGLAFTIDASSRENVHLLLGRKLGIALAEDGDSPNTIDFTGVVAAVRFSHTREEENGYAIHVAFDTIHDQSTIERAVEQLELCR